MSHHSKDHKLLAEAYEAVTPSPGSPMPEKPVMEAPPGNEPKPVPAGNKVRGWFAVYIDGPDEATCEHAAEVVKGLVLQLNGKHKECTFDVDSGPLEYDAPSKE